MKKRPTVQNMLASKFRVLFIAAVDDCKASSQGAGLTLQKNRAWN